MNALLISKINKELKKNHTEEKMEELKEKKAELKEKKAELRRDEKNIIPHKLFKSFFESFCSMKSD